MKKLVLISLMLVLSSGCITINRIQTWQDVQDEKAAFFSTVETIEEAVPETLRRRCGYNLMLERPKTTALTMEQMKEHRSAADDLASGYYNPVKNEAGYLKDDPEALLHEYQHFFDFKMVVTAEERARCDFEIKAYLSEYASKQRDAKEQWKREAQRLKRELDARRFR